MWDDISEIQSKVNSLINKTATKFKDLRMAVVDFRDYPVYPYGETSDYLTKVRTPFTNDLTTIKNAVNAIAVGGGNDWPEAVYSAVVSAVNGTGLNDSAGIGWRESPAKKRIILIGDAPGHFPIEAWAGGNSFTGAIRAAKDANIIIQSLVVGSATLANSEFSSLAIGTGGSLWNADNALSVNGVLDGIIDEIANNSRSPSGASVAFLKPVFTIAELGGGFYNPAKKLFLETQKCKRKSVPCDVNSNKGWRRLNRVEVTGVETWSPKKALKKGQYRWRLGSVFIGSKVLSPDGEIIERVKGRTKYENTFTEFIRVEVIPGEPEKIEPSSTEFIATSGSMTYKWSVVNGASRYLVRVYKLNKKGKFKLFRKRKVKAPADGSDIVILETSFRGHKLGKTYKWDIQGLNIDFPKSEKLFF